MYEKNFFKRLKNLGLSRLIISWDTGAMIVSFLIVGYFTNWSIGYEKSKDILNVFLTISAAFYSIVLAGLAIISSFTDKDFILAWKEIGEYDNIITLFQYNLNIPLVLLLFSFVLRFLYFNAILMIFAISLFVYMIFSLFDLVQLISRYGLQRAEYLERKSKEVEKNH